MEQEKYNNLRKIYGKELDSLEAIMFEGAYRIVEDLEEFYNIYGYCLKDKSKTARIYHGGVRYNFLNFIYDKIDFDLSIGECSNFDEVREKFPLPIYPSDEMSQRSKYEAAKLFVSLQKKNEKELNSTIWAARKINPLMLTDGTSNLS
jgi:hypothetical protein